MSSTSYKKHILEGIFLLEFHGNDLKTSNLKQKKYNSSHFKRAEFMFKQKEFRDYNKDNTIGKRQIDHDFLQSISVNSFQNNFAADKHLMLEYQIFIEQYCSEIKFELPENFTQNAATATTSLQSDKEKYKFDIECKRMRSFEQIGSLLDWISRFDTKDTEKLRKVIINSNPFAKYDESLLPQNHKSANYLFEDRALAFDMYLGKPHLDWLKNLPAALFVADVGERRIFDFKGLLVSESTDVSAYRCCHSQLLLGTQELSTRNGENVIKQVKCEESSTQLQFNKSFSCGISLDGKEYPKFFGNTSITKVKGSDEVIFAKGKQAFVVKIPTLTGSQFADMFKLTNWDRRYFNLQEIEDQTQRVDTIKWRIRTNRIKVFSPVLPADYLETSKLCYYEFGSKSDCMPPTEGSLGILKLFGDQTVSNELQKVPQSNEAANSSLKKVLGDMALAMAFFEDCCSDAQCREASYKYLKVDLIPPVAK